MKLIYKEGEMITVYSSKNRELVGLSTDEKPTNVGENMLFLELDTGNFYYFDGTAWLEIGSNDDANTAQDTDLEQEGA